MARIPYPPPPPAGSAKPKDDGKPRPPPLNVAKIISHSTGTAPHWAGVAVAHYTSIALEAKLRELAILLTAAKLGSTYEFTHHTHMSKNFGVVDAQRKWIWEVAGKNGAEEKEKGGVLKGVQDAVKEGIFTDKEAVLLALVENIVETGVVGEELWKRARSYFGERELVDVCSVVGFYFTKSRITTMFEIELEDNVKPVL
ncbi:AhpD-like protein [Microdochium bolleyi]|uniref:AhpD-like protein n=1 Tax=Microdochium bolleyi TaxID=196109 RepID=A0A136IWL2_9PEZI|nr:AhpD-like protein [Microdochium bolleyi]